MTDAKAPKERGTPKTWYVYLLTTLDEKRTYIGASVDVQRRLRQHNGEICGGARYTSRRPGQWKVVSFLTIGHDKIRALRTEYKLKKRSKGVAQRLAKFRTVAREEGLELAVL
jgi:predicted GIY-YIG superfamily endonuclease